MRRTPAGSESDTFAATSTTSAPRRRAPSASASPIRPLERLPMKRTESIGSRVPPAVTSTRSPSQDPRAAGRSASTSASSRSGDGSRPTPISPREASAPSSGSITRTPRSRSVARFAWVAGSAYMRSFIAGATTRGAGQARNEVVSIESAIPAASLAIVFAEAGAIKHRSALAASSRWPIGSWSGSGSPGNAPRSGSRSNSSSSTGAPTMPSNEAEPTKRCAAGVISTRTPCPARVASRASSRAL